MDIRIQLGDVLTFEADVIALKYAQSLYGADRAVAAALGLSEAQIHARLPAVGSPGLFEGSDKVGARQVLFLSVSPLSQFGYDAIRRFAYDVLYHLSRIASDTRHLALTIHGAGYGLDEADALRSEVAGLLSAVSEGRFPRALERITIVEHSAGRAERLRAVLADAMAGAPQSGPEPRTMPPKLDAAAHPVSSATAPPRAKKPYVFVAMPFTQEMEDVYRYGIQGPIQAAGWSCGRVDQDTFHGGIVQRILECIEAASCVVADVSDANANVCLEVGYAWGNQRPTILLTRKPPESLPFDLRGHRCIVYQNIHGLEKQLSAEFHRLAHDLPAADPNPAEPAAEPAVSGALLDHLRSQFGLEWHGIHGISHWQRVAENGRRLCPLTGAEPLIVELFAYIHDAGRQNDTTDPGHGKRSAGMLQGLQGRFCQLSQPELDILEFAITYHSSGWTQADPTVQTCWDADRLDLGRVGERPDPTRLCTPAARQPEVIEWAYQRSVAGHAKEL